MQHQAVLSSLSFLIVDDMESMRVVLNSLLRQLGAEKIQEAKDGHDAWQILSKSKIDVVISDLDMPKVDGIDLLKKIRGSIEHKQTPFLLLTGAMEKERVKAAVFAGVDDYLVKPFNPKNLEQRILKLVKKVESK